MLTGCGLEERFKVVVRLRAPKEVGAELFSSAVSPPSYS